MPTTRYAKLRNQLLRESLPSVFAPVILRDAEHDYIPITIPERLIQCIWYDQRIQHTGLHTTDNRPVEIIFPGWWNLEAGPDFRNATIKLDGQELNGDIEIHLRAGDWYNHGHEREPLYNNVVLHVILDEAGADRPPRTQAGDTPPQLVLQHQLSAPLETLHDEIDLDAYPFGAGNHGQSCASTITQLPAAAIDDLLDEAGCERLNAKARKFSRWILRAGAEQAFYEAWMEALGYKANKIPFRLLARSLPIAELRQLRHATCEAVIFGLANFLPTTAARSNDPHIGRLWRAWWKLRPDYADKILTPETWRFHGQRPANHPHRRLGAACALLKKFPNLLEAMIGAVQSGGDPAKLLLNIRHDYWQHHYTLGGKTQTRTLEVIGEDRANEILSNVVYPFLLAVAGNDHDDALRKKVLTAYKALPAAPSNSILRLVSRQLLGSTGSVKTTLRQQGLMQVFQDFCVNDKSACRKCQFPALALRWSAAYNH